MCHINTLATTQHSTGILHHVWRFPCTEENVATKSSISERGGMGKHWEVRFKAVCFRNTFYGYFPSLKKAFKNKKWVTAKTYSLENKNIQTLLP